ncbi:hypothetical protein [Archangium violaceum]|uniref:hypothetical protein n=1 Tax=Archangium violaceum TaxID=83451 RepID=UPI0036DAE830
MFARKEGYTTPFKPNRVDVEGGSPSALHDEGLSLVIVLVAAHVSCVAQLVTVRQGRLP